MHSKSDNIEIGINDETDDVIEELCYRRSLSSTMIIYCNINIIK